MGFPDRVGESIIAIASKPLSNADSHCHPVCTYVPSCTTAPQAREELGKEHLYDSTLVCIHT